MLHENYPHPTKLSRQNELHVYGLIYPPIFHTKKSYLTYLSILKLLSTCSTMVWTSLTKGLRVHGTDEKFFSSQPPFSSQVLVQELSTPLLLNSVEK